GILVEEIGTGFAMECLHRNDHEGGGCQQAGGQQAAGRMARGIADAQANKSFGSMGELLPMAATHPDPDAGQNTAEQKAAATEKAACLSLMIFRQETYDQAAYCTNCRCRKNQLAQRQFLFRAKSLRGSRLSCQQTFGCNLRQGARGPEDGQQTGGQCGE